MTATLSSAPSGAEKPAAAPAARPPRRRSNGTVAATSVSYAILVVLAVVYILPFLIQLATSFKTDADATAHPVSLIPQVWTTAAYTKLFLNSDFPTWFANSAIVTAMRSPACTSAAGASSSPRSSRSCRCRWSCCSSRSSW